jgi:hypothetical protein
VNFADHQLSAQSSIISFVEGSGKLGRLGDQSPSASSATLDGMFEFRHPRITARSSWTRRAGTSTPLMPAGSAADLQLGAAPRAIPT